MTGLLFQWTRGDPEAMDRLLPLVYAELRRIAARQLRGEYARQTLNPTALVHEVYLRLVDRELGVGMRPRRRAESALSVNGGGGRVFPEGKGRSTMTRRQLFVTLSLMAASCRGTSPVREVTLAVRGMV